MASLGYGLLEDGPRRRLLDCVQECRVAWQHKPEMKDVLYDLDKACRALEYLGASAGHRAAVAASPPVMSGQESHGKSEGLGG